MQYQLGFLIIAFVCLVIPSTAQFEGGFSDGHDNELRRGYTLNNESIGTLYQGGSGDGFDEDELSNITLSGESISVIYGEGGTFGSGDGFDVNVRKGLTLDNQSIAVLYEGGFGDGYDLEIASGLSLAAEGDSDGDMIPDFWEDQYAFLDPNNPLDAALDFDGDGRSNLDEYFADTDPSQSLSFFSANIRLNGLGTYEVYFDTSAQRYYRLEISEDLHTNWNFSVPARLGSGSEDTFPIPNGPDRNFGRIKVAPFPPE